MNLEQDLTAEEAEEVGLEQEESTEAETAAAETAEASEKRSRTPSYPDETVLVRTDVEIQRPKHKMVADAFTKSGTKVGTALDKIVAAAKEKGTLKAKGFEEDPRSYMRSYVGKMVAAGALRPKG